MRITTAQIRKYKQDKKRFAALTAYDVVTARLVDQAGIPIILVGDSLGMVVLGYENTIPVTLDDIIHHTRAVVRGSETSMVVADLPFMTYHKSPEQALDSAARCMQQGGAQAVKLEGGRVMAPTIRRLTESGIAVMAHIGLTPQSVNQLGGFKAQGKTKVQALTVMEDALAVQEAGAFSVVLECVPAALASLITKRLQIPTIGIGSGPDCDAEIQVVSDILGWITDFQPKHTKRFAHLADQAKQAIDQYTAEVGGRTFPTQDNSFSIDEEVLRDVEAAFPAQV
ncbi:MAG: 3-methyl-2-oxobutanoate hydroxymethyltransferase [Candidatus Atribacteria bacterium]|nr:MAG: 3-methyl-2-oxobutanoate hydroxymethyltransferase [Candidatus Atribacteria bacterium]